MFGLVLWLLGCPFVTDTDEAWRLDPDADGALWPEDCDSADPAVSPYVVEDCLTEADDDCNGRVNEQDALNCVELYEDVDGDGWGGDRIICQCTPGEHAATVGGDCQDGVSDVHPGAAEDCATNASDDCDDDTNDLGAVGCLTWYADADGDGYGTDASVCACEPRDGYSAAVAGDCDDGNVATYPGAPEDCYDGVDGDCDGASDDC